MLRKWGMLVIALLISPVFAYAQNTGKVAGVVTDGETGDPLPGASVVLLGTQWGTISDVDGNYFIIGVPVGTYDVQASFVGFGTQTVSGVEVSSGYTREINFTLSPGIQLDEVVVEYERPLIQKDAVGVPKIVTAEEIVNLPVRGASSVAAIQAGVVNKEGSGTLNIRGGRGAEVNYYIDGVKVLGSTGVPQSAVQEQEMIIGNISAKYGDAMSGIINITTKTGSTKYFGSLEGVTSEMLDPYGYNLFSGAIGGPISGRKLNFFLAGEYQHNADSGPRAFGEIYLPDDVIADLEAFPSGLRQQLADGSYAWMNLPSTIPAGTRLLVDDSGHLLRTDGSGTPLGTIDEEGHFVPDETGGNLFFYTCADASDASCTDKVAQTVIPVPDGVDLATLSLRPLNRGEYDTDPDLFEVRKEKRNREFQRMSLSGNMVFNVLEDARLRVGGRYIADKSDGNQSAYYVPYAVNFPTVNTSKDYQLFATWTHYLSNSTFFQVQADYANDFNESWDDRFGKNPDDWLRYGDVGNSLTSDLNWVGDGEAAWQTLRGYVNPATDAFAQTEDRIDADGNTVTVAVPSYVPAYRDGSGPTFDVVSSLVSTAGGRPVTGYSKSNNSQLRFSAQATTQIGLNQIEFGGEFEQQTRRSWSIPAYVLSRFVNDGNYDPRAVENLASTIRDKDGDGINDTTWVNSYSDMEDWLLWSYVTNYGYDLRGETEVDTQNLDQLLDKNQSKPTSYYNRAPFKPIYYGGYVQDKIEFRDIVMNLGLRVDVFDNNQLGLKDRFQRRPACQVGNLGAGDITSALETWDPEDRIERTVNCGAVPTEGIPGNVGNDYTVFYNSGGGVVGYRSTSGAFFDTQGQQANPGDILLNAAPRTMYGEVLPSMFTDYAPTLTVMPRIGVSFPVTDQALFFARFGITSQRPSSNSQASLTSMTGTGGINNPMLQPEKTTEYELGFRQRLGARAALTISGFFRQIENLIQGRELRAATPSVYTSYENVDFGTVKGAEFAFDLRRTGGLAASVNYTLSFANGTGSYSGNTGTITWVSETPPNFISPLDFDQRHRFNISLDYRLGKGEGPTLGGMKLLENFGVNVLFTGGSGYPFTPVIEPFNLAGAARAARPVGGVNSGRMPGSSRVDIRIDRKFALSGSATFSAFIWVQNLLDQINTNNVWRFTGLPGDDGFLATAEGAQYLSDKPPVAEDLYQHRTRSLGNVGIPRMTRIGFRVDF